MGSKGICLLVVNDDLTCHNIVSEMLQSCTYEVLHVGRALETLSAVCERKDTINLVLTNLHRIQGQVTTDILHHIQKRLNLPTFLMSPDEEKIELKGEESAFAAYFLSSLSINDVDNLWELASVTVIEGNRYDDSGSKEEELEEEVSGQVQSKSQDSNIEATAKSMEKTPSTNNDDQPRLQQRKRKRKRRTKGDTENGEKKPRMIWTDELHQKFLEAMEYILPDKPVPKKIVEVMNMPWLKREHVASHLQKYRMLLKKAQETGVSDFGLNPTNHFGEPKVANYWRSSLNFDAYRLSPSSRFMGAYGNGKPPFHMSASSNRNLLHAYNSMHSRLSSLSNLKPPNMLQSEGNVNNQGNLQQSAGNQNFSSSNIQESMLQKKSYLGSQRNIDWRGGFLQRHESTYGPGGNVAVNNGFRLNRYGANLTQNTLFSIQGGSSSNTNAANASDMQTENCLLLDEGFVGLKLTDDGKALEIGGTGVSGSNQARREISPISGSENENLDYQIQPPININDFKVLPPDHTVQQQNDDHQYQNQLVSNSMENSTIRSASLSPCNFQQHHVSAEDLCTIPGDIEAIQWLANNDGIPLQEETFLPHLDSTPALWDSSIPASNEQQPSFPGSNWNNIFYDPTQNNSMASSGNETPVDHFSSLLSADPQQEITNNVPNLLGISDQNINASRQEGVDSVQQIPQQESSTPLVLDELLNSSWADGNFSALMNDQTESSSHKIYLHGDFDQDTLFID